MGLIATEAVVLSSVKLGDADRLVTFYTAAQGRTCGVANGSRGMKSRFGAALEPLTHCNLILFESGQHDRLARVRQADVLHFFEGIRGDFGRLRLAVQMSDLVRRMTPEGDPNPALFRLLLDGLASLEKQPDPPLSKTLFTVHLIACCGYQPRWDNCIRCRTTFNGGGVFFSASDGGYCCPRCAAARPQHLLSVSGGTRAYLRQIARLQFDLAHRLKPSPEIKKEADAVLSHHLAFVTGCSPRAARISGQANRS